MCWGYAPRVQFRQKKYEGKGRNHAATELVGRRGPRADHRQAAVVDCILIDPAYNGRLFNVVLGDVPERKQDLVAVSALST